MEPKSFELLLNDLYDKYNPVNKKDIPNIIQKYIGQEFDAVYYFLMKYNYPKHLNFNSNLNDIVNIKQLLKDYNDGKRTMLEPGVIQPSFEEQIKETIFKETESKLQNTTEQISLDVKELLTKSKNDIDKLKEEFQKQLILNNNTNNNNVEVKLNILYTETELNLPKEINDFNIGTRFLIKDVSGKLIALEVKDVFCDFISSEIGFIKEITIDKV